MGHHGFTQRTRRPNNVPATSWTLATGLPGVCSTETKRSPNAMHQRHPGSSECRTAPEMTRHGSTWLDMSHPAGATWWTSLHLFCSCSISRYLNHSQAKCLQSYYYCLNERISEDVGSENAPGIFWFWSLREATRLCRAWSSRLTDDRVDLLSFNNRSPTLLTLSEPEIHAGIPEHAWVQKKYVHMCVCVYVCIYIYVCMYVCLCVYVCMHACMYVCMYVKL